MRSIISTLTIILVVAAVSLNAQPGNGFGMSGMHPFITQHASELNLTEGQMKEVAELNLEFRQEFRANRRASRGQRGAYRSGRRVNQNTEWIEARTDYHNRMMEILTDEQKQTLQNSMRERVENAHQFRMIQHEVLLDEAGLEGDRRGQVLALMNEHSGQMMETRLENLETPGNFSRFGGVGFESRTELHNQLKDLLTAAEYQKLQEMIGTPRYGDYRSGRRGKNSRFNR